ncbi:hypothetical protein T11_18152 [Trichinella zimbabwensis]|uniref:Uncharacterized protein n=1 Tax=Trichinella zimbabwensis TaxID=268475 RepID=A0A0V1GE51_9BILA|nr:hypothetical protein T11_18152 [Trichinella zimbabwensis]
MPQQKIDFVKTRLRVRFQVNNLQVKACSANEKIIFDEC